MSREEPIRGDVVQALPTPLIALAMRPGETSAQAGGSSVRVDTTTLASRAVE